jgi:hypothetical protein
MADPHAACAAIAALPHLQALILGKAWDVDGASPIAALRHPAQLTYLGLSFSGRSFEPADPARESVQQLLLLSRLVNLRRLTLLNIPYPGVPGGVPAELSKLTALVIFYKRWASTTSQFQHLSSLTELQEMTISSVSLVADDVADIITLTQLTHLVLGSMRLELTSSSTRSWARLTALQSLSLRLCRAQADVVAALTQLRALTLFRVKALQPEDTRDTLRLTLSQLPLLTQLAYVGDHFSPGPPPADAFTALTASSNLCSLQVGVTVPVLRGTVPCGSPFTLGAMYPHLRLIDLQYKESRSMFPNKYILSMAVSEQQLQQLCSSCPAVEALAFNLCSRPSPTALQPLLQLSALTRLGVYNVGSATATVAGVAAQLTGLKQLVLGDLQQLADPSLLQLTVLTALRGLTLRGEAHAIASLELVDKVRVCHGSSWRLHTACPRDPGYRRRRCGMVYMHTHVKICLLTHRALRGLMECVFCCLEGDRPMFASALLLL